MIRIRIATENAAFSEGAGGAEDSAVYYEWASDYAGVIFDALDISSDEQNKP